VRLARAFRGLLTPVSAGITLALIAVAVVDGLVVADRRAEAGREAAHERLVASEHAYLDQVRRVAGRLPAEVLPVQLVLRALENPHAGDIFAARDALSRPDALRVLGRELHTLRGLHVPAPLRSRARYVVDALDHIRSAVLAMHQLHDVVDPRALNLDIQTTAGGALGRGIDEWRQGLQALFVRMKEKAPGAPASLPGRHGPQTLMGWTFAADRACVRVAVRAFPLLPALRRRPVDLDAAQRLGEMTVRLAAQLRAVPRPPGATDLRAKVTGRLVTLRSWGQALTDESIAAQRGDVLGVQRAFDRFRTTTAAMPTLAKGFRGMHATACANYVATGRQDTHRHGTLSV